MEVGRRFFGVSDTPDVKSIIIVSIFALLANGLCLYILQNSKGKEEVHMKASMIFTANDILINLGVIVAAVLVFWCNSRVPDLIIGAIVFILVIRGANRILQLGK